MNKQIQILLTSASLTVATVMACASACAYEQSLVDQIVAQAPKLASKAIIHSLQYLEAHSSTFSNQNFIGIANFNQPSTEPRFYLIELKTGKVQQSFVAHGKNTSNPANRALAKSFSNAVGSDMSSLGVYRTFRQGELTINGEAGVYSERGHLRTRLRGLQSSNNMAEVRDVVIHAAPVVRIGNAYAPYVSGEYIKYHGFLGESEGCLAFNPDEIDGIVQQLEGAALIYAYASAS